MAKRFVLSLLISGAVLAACTKSGVATSPAAATTATALTAATAPPAEQSMPAMQAPQTLEQWAHGAKLFDGLGDLAQQYFDQGMRFLWGFNHDEATRSFAEAAVLDPQCAMCYWGVAPTVGPNYNLPLMAQARA